METKFLTVGEGLCKYGKGDNYNKLCGVGLEISLKIHHFHYIEINIEINVGVCVCMCACISLLRMPEVSKTEIIMSTPNIQDLASKYYFLLTGTRTPWKNG